MRRRQLTVILDGKSLANEIINHVADYDVEANVAIVQIGNNPASNTYVNNKIKRFKQLGWTYKKITIDEDCNWLKRNIINTINQLNEDSTVTGIFVQLPIPRISDRNDLMEIFNAMSPLKDVDGLSCKSISGWVSGIDQFDDNMDLQYCNPCTPAGIIKLLDHYDIEIDGKRVVVIGRSMIVGTPLVCMLTNRNATVTLCHSRTNNLDDITKEADIIISAVGKPNFINTWMISQGVVLIDVGINHTENGLVGDVNPDCYHYANAYTPVPGGVGPMTVAMLCENVCNCAMQQSQLEE